MLGRRLDKAALSIIFAVAVNCGGEGNIADCDEGISSVPCSARTPDEEARLALDREDYATAVELLTQLVAAEPDVYQRYTVLAAALAGQAGLDIFALAKNQTSDGGTILDLVNQFLPDPALLTEEQYEASIITMNSAVNRLLAIPEALRAATSAERYASSARFQLTLYQTSYSIMYINQFTTADASGGLDAEKLASMSDEDAAVIIDSLIDAAASGQEGDNSVVQAKINEALADIEAQPGASRKEKLQEYLRNNN